MDSVVIVVQRADRFVGVGRKDDPTAALGFGLPGGKVEPGEAPKHAAWRELLEETGLGARALLRLRFGRPGVTAYYAMCHDEEEPTTQPGEGVVKWCTREELEAGPFSEYNRALFSFMFPEEG